MFGLFRSKEAKRNALRIVEMQKLRYEMKEIADGFVALAMQQDALARQRDEVTKKYLILCGVGWSDTHGGMKLGDRKFGSVVKALTYHNMFIEEKLLAEERRS